MGRQYPSRGNMMHQISIPWSRMIPPVPRSWLSPPGPEETVLAMSPKKPKEKSQDLIIIMNSVSHTLINIIIIVAIILIIEDVMDEDGLSTEIKDLWKIKRTLDMGNYFKRSGRWPEVLVRWKGPLMIALKDVTSGVGRWENLMKIFFRLTTATATIISVIIIICFIMSTLR